MDHSSRKRRREHSNVDAAAMRAHPANFVDLTETTPEPDLFQSNTKSMSSDEAFARQLQEQFDLENTGVVLNAGPSTLSNGPASSTTWERHDSAAHSTENDEALARMLQTGFDDDLTAYSAQTVSQTQTPGYQDLSVSSSQRPSFGNSVLHSGGAHAPRNAEPPLNTFAKATSEPQLQAKEVQTAVRRLTKSVDGRNAGNLKAIFDLLCDFDSKSKHNKPGKKSAAKKGKAVGGVGSGIGYGGNSRYTSSHTAPFALYGSYSTFSTNGDYNPYTSPTNEVRTLQKSDADDTMTTGIMKSLEQLVPNFEKEGDFNIDPPAKHLQSLFLCSSILERAAELLRTNDLEDVLRRAELYQALVRFLRALASHPATSPLVLGERVIRTPGVRIKDVSKGKANLSTTDATDTTQPLANCLKELAAQSSIMLRSNGVAAEDLHMFQSIKSLHDFLVTNAGSEEKSVDTRNAWRRELAVSEVLDEVIVSRHSLVSKAEAGTHAPGRMKRIMQEIARLQAGLPDGIFVRYAESRPDVMKAIIVGPKDTPYENGLFEFDILCGANFPNGPPSVNFRTTGGGAVGFNPNLYANGKVCLSLLGTWSGEQWSANKSTLLQVLVSIQAMIFCEKPWQNEPGRERMADAENQCRAYNKGLYPHTVQLAMLDWLERRDYPLRSAVHRYPLGPTNPDNGFMEQGDSMWDEIVKRHFQDNEQDILTTVGEWVHGGKSLAIAGSASRLTGDNFLQKLRGAVAQLKSAPGQSRY